MEYNLNIAGADMVISFFGYWPSFHDAAVLSIWIDREGPSVTILFKVNEMGPSNIEPDRRALVKMRWNDLEDLELSGCDPDGNNWIWGLDIEASEDCYVTTLKKMHGIQGRIIARQIEVLEIEPLEL